MSQELHAAVTRARAKKPVVVYMGDTAASGGYYTACAADEIVANPGTLTASIGVIMSGLSFQELTNKLGIKSNTVKSGKFKDLMSPYHTATADETALLQGLINSSYHQFLGAVLEGRLHGLKDDATKAAREASIRAVADGRVVTGEQGLAVGLVDTLGDIDVAHERLNKRVKERFKLGGEGRLPLETFDSGHHLLDLLSLGLSGQAHMLGSLLSSPSQSASDVVERSLGGVMPFSARHPKQPLWMME
jgi:protease-4